MIENSYYENNFNHDGQIVSKNQKIISPAKTGVHASICICKYLPGTTGTAIKSSYVLEKEAFFERKNLKPQRKK